MEVSTSGCYTVDFNVDAESRPLRHGDHAELLFPHGLSVTSKRGRQDDDNNDSKVVIYRTGAGGANPELELGVGNVLIVQDSNDRVVVQEIISQC